MKYLAVQMKTKAINSRRKQVDFEEQRGISILVFK